MLTTRTGCAALCHARPSPPAPFTRSAVRKWTATLCKNSTLAMPAADAQSSDTSGSASMPTLSHRHLGMTAPSSPDGLGVSAVFFCLCSACKPAFFLPHTAGPGSLPPAQTEPTSQGRDACHAEQKPQTRFWGLGLGFLDPLPSP